MHFQVVQNQEHLAPAVPDQARQESDQDRRRHRFVVQHKAHLALVRHRRNHVGRKPATRHPLHQGFAGRRVATSVLTVTAKAGLIPQ